MRGDADGWAAFGAGGWATVGAAVGGTMPEIGPAGEAGVAGVDVDVVAAGGGVRVAPGDAAAVLVSVDWGCRSAGVWTFGVLAGAEGVLELTGGVVPGDVVPGEEGVEVEVLPGEVVDDCSSAGLAGVVPGFVGVVELGCAGFESDGVECDGFDSVGVESAGVESVGVVGGVSTDGRSSEDGFGFAGVVEVGCPDWLSAGVLAGDEGALGALGFDGLLSAGADGVVLLGLEGEESAGPDGVGSVCAAGVSVAVGVLGEFGVSEPDGLLDGDESPGVSAASVLDGIVGDAGVEGVLGLLSPGVLGLDELSVGEDGLFAGAAGVLLVVSSGVLDVDGVSPEGDSFGAGELG